MQIIKPQLEGCSRRFKNDCTVVALSTAANIPYDEAFEFALECGRKPNRGFKSEVLIESFNKKKQNIFKHVEKNIKICVRKFLLKYPKGTFYVRKRGHAFAIKDGVVLDLAGEVTLRCMIKDAWMVK